MRLIEGSSLIRLPLTDQRHSPDLNKLRQLEKTFPGKIAVFPPGSALFHRSRNPDALLAKNRFDSKFSKGAGAFFFSDIPIPGMSNCTIAVVQMLALFSDRDLSDSDWEKLRSVGGKFAGGVTLGFDGYVNLEGDECTLTENGYAPEIVVFATSLHKLGAITFYYCESP